MSFAATHLVGFGAGEEASTPAAITFAAAAVSTSNVTDSTYTFSSHSIGTASSDRYVIVGVALGNINASGTCTAVSVAGTSCTQVVSQLGSGNSGRSEIWISNSAITSGTTGDVVVTTGGGALIGNCGIATYAATGLVSTTAGDTATQTADATATDLDVTADGIAVLVARSGSTAAGTTTNLTERYDAQIEVGGSWHTGACDNQATTQTLSITVDFATASFMSVAMAAFR